jgi:hypothetical protein
MAGCRAAHDLGLSGSGPADQVTRCFDHGTGLLSRGREDAWLPSHLTTHMSNSPDDDRSDRWTEKHVIACFLVHSSATAPPAGGPLVSPAPPGTHAARPARLGLELEPGPTRMRVPAGRHLLRRRDLGRKDGELLRCQPMTGVHGIDAAARCSLMPGRGGRAGSRPGLAARSHPDQHVLASAPRADGAAAEQPAWPVARNQINATETRPPEQGHHEDDLDCPQI